MLIATLAFTAAAHVYYAWLWFFPQKRLSNKYIEMSERMTPENGLAAMKIIEEIVAQSGINAFWLSGTLLGLERQGRPLDHDHDLDLGIMIDDPAFATFIDHLKSSPRVIEFRTQQLGEKSLIQNPDLRLIENGVLRAVAKVLTATDGKSHPVKIDIFYHFHYRKGIMHASQNSIWWNSNFSTQIKKYGKNSFRVPTDIHRHLTENYGDYKTEVKEFENSIDCPNTMNIYSWTSLVYLLRRKALMIKLGKKLSLRRLNQRIFATILKGLLPRNY